MGNFDSTLTSKGQTTIPIEVRDRLNLKPGDKIRYVLQGDRVYLRVKNRDAMELAGMLHDPDRKPLTVQDMDRAIADHTVEEDRRVTDDWDRHQRSS